MHETKLVDVLARAHEIEGQLRAMDATESEIETFVTAAQEAGLSRDSVMQALRERIGYAPDAYREGELVFAKSSDGHFYAARISEVKDSSAKLRFLNGSDGHVSIGDLRLFSLTPGQTVQYLSPSYSTWLTAQVQRVNLEGGSAAFSYWGTVETVPLESVRLISEEKTAVMHTANYWWSLTGMFLFGSVVGWLITLLLTRR